MRTKNWILIIFFLTAFIKSSTAQKLSVKNELQSATIIDSILIEQRAVYNFSKVDKKDEFYICIRGKSIVEGKVIFTIVSHDKTTILREDFPSYL